MATIDREEKGYPPPDANALPSSSVTAIGSRHETATPPPQQHHNHRIHLPHIGKHHESSHQHTNSTLLPINDKLRVFRALTGIESSLPGLAPTTPQSKSMFRLSSAPQEQQITRQAPNIGIYHRVIQAEALAAKRYRIFSTLINTCLGIQIVVAAALTAIGAARGPYRAITAFGAINTIMAGILTYLKGSGLPNREKYYEHEWGKVRMYVEQREREFCLEGCELDVEEEIMIVENMFQEVRRRMEEGGASEGGGSAVSEMGSKGSKRKIMPAAATAIAAVKEARRDDEKIKEVEASG
jgi:hypothetical protein